MLLAFSVCQMRGLSNHEGSKKFPSSWADSSDYERPPCLVGYDAVLLPRRKRTLVVGCGYSASEYVFRVVLGGGG